MHWGGASYKNDLLRDAVLYLGVCVGGGGGLTSLSVLQGRQGQLTTERVCVSSTEG